MLVDGLLPTAVRSEAVVVAGVEWRVELSQCDSAVHEASALTVPRKFRTIP